MKTCSILFEDIVNYYEEHNDPATQDRVRQHLDDGCLLCQKRLNWVRQFLPALHSTFSEATISAPMETRDRARQIARESHPTSTRPPLVERIAKLLFDSLRPLSPLAVRGSEGPEAQKLYATEGHYVEVWIERMQEGGYYLIGQTVSKIDRATVRPHSVTLIAENGERTQARQEGNEFHLASVNMGAYQMRLRLDEEEIVLPQVLVGTRDVR